MSLSRARLFSAGLIVALAGVETVRLLDWNIDDGYIPFRIVKNLLAGLGWHFNPGEAVNASTSVLNTLLIWILALPGFDIPRAAHVVGGAALAMAGLATWVLLRRQGAREAVALAGALVSVVVLSVSGTWGLETHLFVALLLLLPVVFNERRRRWTVIALLTLARPDGALAAVIAAAVDGVLRDGKNLARGLLIYGAILAPWVIFSLSEFGSVFPSTLHNKMWQGQSGFWGSGAVYLQALLDHWRASPWRSAVALLSLFALARFVRDRDPFALPLAFVFLQQLAYCVLNVPGYSWYFVPFDLVALVACCLYLVRMIPQLRASAAPFRGERWIPAAFALVLAVPGYQAIGASFEDERDQIYRALVAGVRSNGLPEGAIATVEVGTFGYHFPGKIIDMIGLTTANPEFISGKNNALFFADMPAMVILHSPPWKMERAILHDPRFMANYRAAEHVRTPRSGVYAFRRIGASSVSR